MSGQLMATLITRHYIDIATRSGRRRVHYRKCGNGGPTVLMVHQKRPKDHNMYLQLPTYLSLVYLSFLMEFPKV